MSVIWDKTRRFIIRSLAPVDPVLCDRIMFLHRFHRLKPKNPKTLNEKILWLKENTYAHDPLVRKCADKYAVRDYVIEKGCGESLNELLACWDDPTDIDWDSLPEKYVIKCNHGCGYNLICSDKSNFDRTTAVAKLNQWQKSDYWREYAELQYKDINKKILCEKYLGNESILPIDYKIYCFNSRPLYILVCLQRWEEKTKFYFFDKEWNFCRITHDGMDAESDFSLPRPKHFDQMIRYAERLSSPFPFVRVDFYDTDEKPVFGELTFTPSAGFDANRLYDTDVMFGELLTL